MSTLLVEAPTRLHSIDQLQQQIEKLLDTEIDFIDNPEFREPAAEAEILGTAEMGDAQQAICEEGSQEEWPSHLSKLCNAPLLSAEMERELFRRMNYLKFRANALRGKLNPQQPCSETLASAERYLKLAALVRDSIIQANMRLVVSIVKKFVAPQFSFDELLSDGIVTLMNTVEKFDYGRGFRFSTYAYRSISRDAYRNVMERKNSMSRFASVEEDEIPSDVEGGSGSLDEKTWEKLHGLLMEFLPKLDERERKIIQARYALGEQRKVQTFQSLADQLGISKERVRQLAQRAERKLQIMATEAQVANNF